MVNENDGTGNYKEKFIIPIRKDRDDLAPLRIMFSSPIGMINEQGVQNEDMFLGSLNLDMRPCFENRGHFVVNNIFTLNLPEALMKKLNTDPNINLPNVYLQIKFLSENMQDDGLMANGTFIVYLT